MAKILVIEDNQDLRELFALILEMNGYDVGMAYDKEHALHMIDSTKPDLVLLDLLLRNENGSEICRIIKQKNKDIRVILVSSNLKLLTEFDGCLADGIL